MRGIFELAWLFPSCPFSLKALCSNTMLDFLLHLKTVVSFNFKLLTSRYYSIQKYVNGFDKFKTLLGERLNMLDWGEYLRWLEAAERTLISAEKESDNNWACFKAEQSAQLAAKALLVLIGRNYFGHDLLALINRTEMSVTKELLDCAAYLGKLYISTRYPDALPGSTPYAYYSEEDKKKAVECAKKILGWVKKIGEDFKRKERAEE